MMMKPASFLLIVLLVVPHLNAQHTRESDLFQTLKTRDELLFNRGFNHCELRQFENLVSDDFEFYHDEAGLTASKEAFIKSIREGLCQLSYKPRRELVPGSLKVYPLKNNGVLYGAIQTGIHRFYAIEKDKPKSLTSVAKFTHLWKLEQGEWKLSRALSYAHQPGKKK